MSQVINLFIIKSIKPSMQISDIRGITIGALIIMKDDLSRNGGALQISNIIRKVTEFARAQGLPFDDRNQKHQVMLLEVVHELMNQGIIMWGISTDGSESGPPFMSITSYGDEVLKAGGEILPNDYDGYLSYFKQEIPNSEQIILMYLSESLQTFFSRNYLASSVMLGVASEAAFEVLFSAMTSYLTGPKKSKFERLQK